MRDWKVSAKQAKEIISALSLARSSMGRCPAVVRLIENGFDGTHHADICVRADGKDYHAEGDWARWALRVLRDIAVDNGVSAIPNNNGGYFNINPKEKP